MPIYEFGQDRIQRIEETRFSLVGLQERRDLQRLLREHVEVISPDTLVISEEFGEWEESRRRIDLLGIDKSANLVVIELKRTEDGGHMELQAIRYAAMISTMTFDHATQVFGRYLDQVGKQDLDPRGLILDFLGWEEADDDQFAQDVRIILASAEFSRELTSSVLWLIDHDIDVRCVRLKPYSLEGRILVDVQQIIPLPEVEEYQIKVREKARKERQARTSNADFTRFDLEIDGQSHSAVTKRNAIFLVCKRLCETGADPDNVSAIFPWRPTRVWYVLDGSMNAAEFKKLATTRSVSGGKQFKASRWFCDDGELIHANGKTYSFSTQWGGEKWYRAMNLLKEKHPELAISFAAAT